MTRRTYAHDPWLAAAASPTVRAALETQLTQAAGHPCRVQLEVAPPSVARRIARRTA